MADAIEYRNDDILAELVIRVRRDGAMSVAGSIQDEVYALTMLEAARESVKSHHARQKLAAGKSLILPAESSLRP